MLLKVHDGTPKNASSLCLSCRRAVVIHGQATSIIECAALSQDRGRALEKAQPVYQCSEYDNKAMPSLYQMQQIAWELKPDKKTKKLGFVQPEGNRYTTLPNPLTGKDE